MTNYIAAHSKRFKAYISQRSLANDQIMYASSDETGSSAGFDSFPQFMMENLKKSVVSYAENIDRPFLNHRGYRGLPDTFFLLPYCEAAEPSREQYCSHLK